MYKLQTTPSPVLAAQKERKKYQRPAFEVIDLNMESPLLSGSGTNGTAGFAGVKKDTK